MRPLLRDSERELDRPRVSRGLDDERHTELCDGVGIAVQAEQGGATAVGHPLLDLDVAISVASPAPHALATRWVSAPISPAPMTQTGSPGAMAARLTPWPQMTPSCRNAASSTDAPEGIGYALRAATVTTDA